METTIGYLFIRGVTLWRVSYSVNIELLAMQLITYINVDVIKHITNWLGQSFSTGAH